MEIIELTRYRDDRRARETETEGLSSNTHVDDTNDDDDDGVSPVPAAERRVGARLRRYLTTFMAGGHPGFSAEPRIDELSVHLQRDIGLIDFSPPPRTNRTAKYHHLGRRLL